MKLKDSLMAAAVACEELQAIVWYAEAVCDGEAYSAVIDMEDGDEGPDTPLAASILFLLVRESI